MSTLSSRLRLKRVVRAVTRAVAVVILVPPLAPTTSSTSPSGLSNTLGLIEDNGLLPGYYEIFLDLITLALHSSVSFDTKLFSLEKNTDQCFLTKLFSLGKNMKCFD